MSSDLPSLIQSFLRQSSRLQDTKWQPAADVYRIRGGWAVKFDLAGIDPHDIQVEVSGRRLIVEGTRRDWQLDEGQQHYCMEISYSHFSRSLELPSELDNARISTEYKDGMLLVRLLTEGV